MELKEQIKKILEEDDLLMSENMNELYIRCKPRLEGNVSKEDFEKGISQIISSLTPIEVTELEQTAAGLSIGSIYIK